ncbi:MAG: hydrolase, partial [Gemmatimonadetes bacterium]|nr:hydrolase [Gemmatimonadota bacterium]
GGGVNKSWDGIWEAQVARVPEGWSAEIRIPFRTLNFDPTLDTWGINFQRTVRRKNEEILWSGHRRNEGLRRPIHA